MTSEQILKNYTNKYGNIPLSIAENKADIFYFKDEEAVATCKKIKVNYAKVHVGFRKSCKYSNPVFKGCCVAQDDVEMVKTALSEAEDRFYSKKIQVLRPFIEAYPSTPVKCVDSLLYYIDSNKVNSKTTENQIYSGLLDILDSYAYFVANGCQELPLFGRERIEREKELLRKQEEVFLL
jgi:hypothetical protein